MILSYSSKTKIEWIWILIKSNQKTKLNRIELKLNLIVSFNFFLLFVRLSKIGKSFFYLEIFGETLDLIEELRKSSRSHSYSRLCVRTCPTSLSQIDINIGWSSNTNFYLNCIINNRWHRIKYLSSSNNNNKIKLTWTRSLAQILDCSQYFYSRSAQKEKKRSFIIASFS